MFNTVEEYLDALKAEMEGTDNATIQDALVDAEEHLRTALENTEDELPAIIEEYGTPEETATAYAEVERRTAPALSGPVTKKQDSGLGRFFAIYADPRAWGSLFYMFIAFITGVIYFSWAVTGISLSISFAIFIFGLPVALLFLLSVRGIAWLEGRLVEALLGVRMPRRSLPAPKNAKLLDRIKELLKDKHTWFSLVYMIVQFALGIAYFVVLVTVFALSLTGVAIPILQEVFHLPMVQNYDVYYYMPQWGYPLTIMVGVLLWTSMMHLVKFIGGLHGRFAKFMLIAEQD
ncbi:MAG: hypothetical protein GY755_04365 [Chloroflexi bacterium]|nr:hypothetical protein [Chloroflexota bacterium]